MAELWQREVNRFCHQYLQLETKLDFPSDKHLKTSQVQEAVFSKLFADDAIQYGPPARYQARVLKDLVTRVEASIDDWDEHEVSDNLMSALSVFLATPLLPEAAAVQQKCYVTYHLSSLASTVTDPSITLLENRSLISAGGTTGLRTWEAALRLGDYLCKHSYLVEGKSVLELGSGTGYISILCARYLAATQVLASDGSDDVINNLPENFFLNLLQDSPLIAPTEVKWGHALVGTEEDVWNGGRPIDVVFGADVTYDASVIPALVATLMDLFEMWPRVEAYISATQRNEQTFQVFLQACQKNRLHVEDLHAEIQPRAEQAGPFYNDHVAIRICRVSKIDP